MEKATNLTLYNLFDEIDLDSNTSIDPSNEESIEEITLNDYEVCIDDIDVNISLDAIPSICSGRTHAQINCNGKYGCCG